MVDPEIKKPILSPMLSQFLRRRFMELLGVLLLLLGAGLLISLVSASPGDPSIGVASTNETVNLLGVTGANIANVLEQVLGHAAYGIALFPVCWGYRLIRKQKIGQKRVRLIAAPIAMALLATGFYGIAGGDAGIEGGGVTTDGGALGKIFFDFVASLIPELPEFVGLTTTHYIGIGFGLLGLVIWAWSAALSRAQFILVAAPAGWLFAGARKLVTLLLPLAAGPSEATDQQPSAKPKRKRMTAGRKKQRQEPVLVAGATPLESDAAKPRKRLASKQESLDFGSGTAFKLPAKNLLKTQERQQLGHQAGACRTGR